MFRSSSFPSSSFRSSSFPSLSFPSSSSQKNLNGIKPNMIITNVIISKTALATLIFVNIESFTMSDPSISGILTPELIIYVYLDYIFTLFTNFPLLFFFHDSFYITLLNYRYDYFHHCLILSCDPLRTMQAIVHYTQHKSSFVVQPQIFSLFR